MGHDSLDQLGNSVDIDYAHSMSTYEIAPAWCKTKCPSTRKCDGGSTGTYAKRAYALAVSVAINGRATCAICDTYPVSLTEGEVDRTAPGCYAPGFIAMTCHRCNNERTNLAGFDAEEYALIVLECSEGIEILSPTNAKNLWAASRPEIGETVKLSRFYKG